MEGVGLRHALGRRMSGAEVKIIETGSLESFQHHDFYFMQWVGTGASWRRYQVDGRSEEEGMRKGHRMRKKVVCDIKGEGRRRVRRKGGLRKDKRSYLSALPRNMGQHDNNYLPYMMGRGVLAAGPRQVHHHHRLLLLDNIAIPKLMTMIK